MSLLRENLTNFFCQVLFLQTTIFTDFFLWLDFAASDRPFPHSPFLPKSPRKRKRKRKEKENEKEKRKKKKKKKRLVSSSP
jgi:hypothetical protein